MLKKTSINRNIIINSKEILSKFPKVELHRHLEGTMPLETLFYLAQKNKLDYPDNFEQFARIVQFPKDQNPDFLLFLSKFKNNWYKSFEDIEKVCIDSIKALEKESIFYIELRFSPEHYSLENNFDRIEVTRLIIDTCNKTAKQIGLNIKYLITFNRGKQNQKEMISLYKKIIKSNIPDIVGIDLAGDEINFPPKDFSRFFNEVYNDGLYKATIHAGEVTPPQSIWDAIMLCYASRIGHGVAAIHDKNLQKYLKEKQIGLEQCITSNHQTGSWPDEKTHPCAKLIENNVPVTINTDDPVIQNSDLTDDYIKLVNYFSYDISKLIEINKIAINCSFLKEEEKEALLKNYLKKVSEFEKSYL